MSETIITVTIPDWFGWILIVWLIAATASSLLESYAALLERKIARKLKEQEKNKDGN